MALLSKISCMILIPGPQQSAADQTVTHATLGTPYHATKGTSLMHINARHQGVAKNMWVSLADLLMNEDMST